MSSVGADARSFALAGRTGREDSGFLAGALAAYAAASRCRGETQFALRLGRLSVTLRVVGRPLADSLLPALAQLSTEPAAAPDVTFCAFDGEPPGIMSALQIHSLAPNARVKLTFPSGSLLRGLYDHATRSLSLLDIANRVGIFWTPDGATLPYWERGAPLRCLWAWCCAAHGMQLVHAGAIGRPDGGVLVAGASGSGKSTTTLAAIGSALRYAGDDYTVVDIGTPPRVLCLYSSGKLGCEHARNFSHLDRALDRVDDEAAEKKIFFVWASFPDAVIREMPLRALLFPRLTGADAPRFSPVSAAEALRLMAPSTVNQMPYSDAGDLRRMARLAAALPAFTLDLGGPIDALPAAIDLLFSRCPDSVSKS